MVIKLFQEKQTKKTVSLIIEFSDQTSNFSVEIQPGLIQRYDENLNLIRIEVKDSNLIDRIIEKLDEIIEKPGIKIIRKVA